jgi:hypothetical protein
VITFIGGIKMLAIGADGEIGGIIGLNGTDFRTGSGSRIEPVNVNTLAFTVSIRAYKKVRFLGKGRCNECQKNREGDPAHVGGFNDIFLQFTIKRLCRRAIN